MSTTTTIRLPDELKKADRHERCDDFYATADKRYAKIVKTGKTVPWDDMRDYLKRRLAGAPASRPVPPERIGCPVPVHSAD